MCDELLTYTYRCASAFDAATRAVADMTKVVHPADHESRSRYEVTVRAKNKDKYGDRLLVFEVKPVYHSYWSAGLQSAEKGEA